MSAPVHADVKNLDKKFSVALAAVQHDFGLNLNPDFKDATTRLHYRANTPSLAGFEVTIKGLTLAYLGSGGLSQSNIQKKGDTSYEDVRAGLFFGKEKQFVLLAYYNRFKGLYIENTPEVDPGADLYLKRTDVEAFNAGAGLMYIFSPKTFSAAAAYVQSARQTKSGGSFLLYLSSAMNYYHGTDDLIPVEIEADYGDQKDIRKARFVTTALSLGYAYSVILGKFFLNGTLLFGRGVQTKSYTYNEISKSETDDATKTNIGASIGYNGDAFYTGLSYVQDQTVFKAGTVEFTPSLNSFRAFLGVRF